MKALRTKISEDDLQRQTRYYLQVFAKSEVLFHHPANERKSKIETLKAMEKGQMSGMADWQIWWPGDFGFVELKSVGGTLSKSQKLFRDHCQSNGYRWALCRSLDEFRATLASWGVPTRERRL